MKPVKFDGYDVYPFQGFRFVTFEEEHGLALLQIASSTSAPLTARTKLPALKPGAYRVRLEGEDTAGQAARIDERTYWFDGKTFEEL